MARGKNSASPSVDAKLEPVVQIHIAVPEVFTAGPTMALEIVRQGEKALNAPMLIAAAAERKIIDYQQAVERKRQEAERRARLAVEEERRAAEERRQQALAAEMAARKLADAEVLSDHLRFTLAVTMLSNLIETPAPPTISPALMRAAIEALAILRVPFRTTAVSDAREKPVPAEGDRP